MKTAKIAIAILTGGVIEISGNTYAQQADFGKSEYDSHCAVCHGKLGKGDGPYVGTINTTIPDLTTLARKNGGVFPFERVYELIDGRQTVKAHGPKEMPIWGYPNVLGDTEYRFTPNDDPEARLRTRILALTEYVYRLQVK